jgi:hypothetical protein
MLRLLPASACFNAAKIEHANTAHSLGLLRAPRVAKLPHRQPLR